MYNKYINLQHTWIIGVATCSQHTYKQAVITTVTT